MEKNDVTCPGVEGRFLVFAVFFMRRSINSPFADWVYTLILNIIIKIIIVIFIKVLIIILLPFHLRLMEFY